MKKMIFVLAGILTFAIAPALADTATEAEIKKLIIEDNAYSKKHLKGAEDTVSSEGSLEFYGVVRGFTGILVEWRFTSCS